MVLIVALPGAFIVVCVGLFVDVCVFCSVVFSVDDVVSFLAVVFSVVVTSVAVVTSVVVTPVPLWLLVFLVLFLLCLRTD